MSKLSSRDINVQLLMLVIIGIMTITPIIVFGGCDNTTDAENPMIDDDDANTTQSEVDAISEAESTAEINVTKQDGITITHIRTPEAVKNRFELGEMVKDKPLPKFVVDVDEIANLEPNQVDEILGEPIGVIDGPNINMHNRYYNTPSKSLVEVQYNDRNVMNKMTGIYVTFSKPYPTPNDALIAVGFEIHEATLEEELRYEPESNLVDRNTYTVKTDKHEYSQVIVLIDNLNLCIMVYVEP